MNRALEHRGKGEIDAQACAQHFMPGLRGLRAAGIGELDVGPAGEEVLHVPGALAVAHQDEPAGTTAGFCVHEPLLQLASLRTDSTPTVRVAKSPAPAARMSVSVRCQCARSLPAASTQALTRASASPRILRDSPLWVSRRCTRSAASRRPLRAIACQGPSTFSFSMRARSQSKPMRVPTSK